MRFTVDIIKSELNAERSEVYKKAENRYGEKRKDQMSSVHQGKDMCGLPMRRSARIKNAKT